jgi:glucose-6-phosphate-specific signal transduction histidine kinase
MFSSFVFGAAQFFWCAVASVQRGASLPSCCAGQREFFRNETGEIPDRLEPVTALVRPGACINVCPPMKLFSRRYRAWTDLAIVLIVAAACWWIAANVELIEWLYVLTRQWERFQVDELAVVLVALAIGMTWFALRRYSDARTEVRRRNEAQGRLAESLAEQRRLAQRYVLMQEAERKALARELHDELGQYLNAIKIDAVAIRDAASDGAARAAGAGAIITNADHVYRTVSGLIRRLRPVGLDELGLAAALEHIVDGARVRSVGTRFTLAIEGDVERLGENCDLTIYRLVQEGLTNCAKHASASEVDIRLMRGSDRCDNITLTMTDNGAGSDWAQQREGLGLVGMRERVEALGGALHVTTAPGYGFRFVASFPLDEVKA